jgi:choline dehydrogenase-like flavoprotein
MAAAVSQHQPVPNDSLSEREQKIVLALAAAAIPPGRFLEGGGEGTLIRFCRWLEDANRQHRAMVKALLWSAEATGVARTGRPFSSLPRDRAEEVLRAWSDSGSAIIRNHLRAVLTPVKAAHFDDPVMFRHVGCPHGDDKPRVRVDEAARWMSQVTDGKKTEEDLELVCEVVVVGTGAGGAACAYELASRGRAVLLLEEGDFHRRSSFTSRSAEMSKKLYRDRGLTIALGNINAPVWAGRAVGGSTLINSGTCYRTPERVLSQWRDQMGLPIDSAVLSPYYERVESMLQVAPAPFALTGGVGRVIARGAEKMGYSHHTLARNAPGCDGQGVCCFGCPTGAKRSTDVSYVPAALECGAQLVTAAKVERVLVHDGKAAGVTGRLGSGRRFTVKADAVVISAGSLMTPVLMKRANLCRHSEALGKNLSIHPATKVMALFDEDIDMGSAIPQGYCVDELAAEGIMFEGGSTPLDVTALAVPWVGRKYVDVMESYRHMATFGFMIADTSRGEVRAGLGGSPLITYDLNAHDTDRMVHAIETLSRLFFAAGARRVMPFLPGLDDLTAPDQVSEIGKRKWTAGDIEVTAYHPLGTCRMGTDPRNSVVGPTHETHEIERLFVADGSVVPSPLGVNPQMTIMAMALRAAEHIDERLSR